MGEWLSSALPAVKKLHATSIVTHYRNHKHQPTSAVGEGPAFSHLAGVSSQPAATPPQRSSFQERRNGVYADRKASVCSARWPDMAFPGYI